MTTLTPDVAVYVGRFQPFHLGHLALLKHALEIAPTVVVVIGSAWQARTPKNPLTWQERAEVVRLALTPEERGRVKFLPMRDHYDEARWVQAVQRGVVDLCGESVSVALVGHYKDATSEYLRSFQGWTVISVERVPGADGTAMRDALYAAGAHNVEATLAALVDQAPSSTLDFLRAWLRLPHFEVLREEWRQLAAEKAKWAGSPYAPVFVTVDAVVRCAGHVLLIQRGKAPGKGLYAVPGGFIEQRETVYQSCLRELKEETHLTLLDMTMRSSLVDVAVFDHPDRSQRGRVITHAHYFDLGERELPEVQADDDAQSVEWMPIARLPGLEDRFHDDHFHMLDHFLDLTDG
jgi:bifunctional NMN adenylyltransferase/nudix hydrolase